LERPKVRAVFAAAAAAALGLFAVEGYQSKALNARGFLQFPAPVIATYAHQAELMVKARTAARSNILPPSPAMASDMSRLAGADVLLLFIEAYGAITYDRSEFAAQLAPARAEFDAAIHDT